MKTQNGTRGQGKTIIGVTGMQMMDVIASSFMSSYFLVYLTDYAGLGILGATIAPIILVIGRIIDAVNDPFQGWLIDSAKPKRMGKYKFFSIISTVILAVAICFLYSIPDGIKSSEVLLFIWILFFYLLYDMGASLFAGAPLVQSLTTDNVFRSKLMTFQRLFAIAAGMIFSFFMTFVNGVNASVQNFGKSFSIVTVIFAIAAGVISFLCIALVKEGSGAVAKEDDGVKLKDFFGLFKTNKAFIVNFLAQLFRGFVYALMTATSVYYTKWAYCANLTTGVFDAERLGLISVLSAAITMTPMMVAAVLSPMFAKKLGSSIKLMNLSNWICIISGVAMFVLQMLGILQMSFIIYVVVFAALCFGNGLAFVPTETIWLECMDYNEYKNGKSMGGIINALKKFLGKGQAAVATLLIGGIMALIGYNVDSVTGNYVGELSKMPAMLNWFVAVCALLPAIFAAVTLVIYKFYPITAEIKAEMDRAKEEKTQAEAPTVTE